MFMLDFWNDGPMCRDASLEGGISKPTQCYHELCVLKHQSDVKRNWNFHVDETELILRLFRIVPFSPAPLWWRADFLPLLALRRKGQAAC
jgi:hypothetical protein